MLGEILWLADGIEADAVPGRGGPGPDGGRGGSAGERRLLMAGGRTSRGDWTWVAPEADAADRAVPGPWSLTLLLRGRPAGGSSP